MPPKKAALSSSMSEEVYFLYVSLRVLMAQTGAAPDWRVVSEALGAKVKAHSLYCRFDALKKKAAPGFDEDLPDLEELLKTNMPGMATNKSASGAGQAKSKRVAAPKVGKSVVQDEACDVQTEMAESSTRKRAATTATSTAKKQKTKSASEAHQALDDEDDAEVAV